MYLIPLVLSSTILIGVKDIGSYWSTKNEFIKSAKSIQKGFSKLVETVHCKKIIRKFP
jgi:hypothetical protein